MVVSPSAILSADKVSTDGVIKKKKKKSNAASFDAALQKPFVEKFSSTDFFILKDAQIGSVSVINNELP